MGRSAIIIVCNGAPFIEAQLRHIYNMVDEIIIVEGADATFKHVIGSKRSNDGTINIINKFIANDDKSNKIKFVYCGKTKNHMVRKGNELCSHDLIYQIDIDEFVTHEIIDQAFDKLRSSDLNAIRIPQRWYYKWTDQYISSGRAYCVRISPARLFRNRIDEGLYINHIPPGFYNPKTKKYINIKATHMPYKKYAYHYLALYRSQLTTKMKYYVLRDHAPKNIVKKRAQEYNKATRGCYIKSYKGTLMKEENPFPVMNNGTKLILQ